MPSLAPVYLRDQSPAATYQQLPSAAAMVKDHQHGDGHEPVSVHDLLDLTWHYQCVVSPSFTAAAPVTTLVRTTANSDSDQRRTPSSSTLAATTIDQYPIMKKLKLKMKDEKIGSDYDQFDLLRRMKRNCLPDAAVRWPSLQTTEAVTTPLLHMHPKQGDHGTGARTASSDDYKHEEGDFGYVSLASLLMSGSEASSNITSPIASPSPHHNYIELALDLFNFRKQTKSRSRASILTSARTCRDNERMLSRKSLAVDPSGIGSYARCLAVD